jgi:hypothetical protein
MITKFGSGFPPRSKSSGHSNGSAVDSFYDLKLYINLYVPTPSWPKLWQEISDVLVFNQDVWASGVTAPHIHLGATWEWVSSCTRPSTWYIAGWVKPAASVDATFREPQNSVLLGVQPWARWLTELYKFESMGYSSVSQTVFFFGPLLTSESNHGYSYPSSCKYNVRLMGIQK